MGLALEIIIATCAVLTAVGYPILHFVSKLVKYEDRIVALEKTVNDLKELVEKWQTEHP